MTLKNLTIAGRINEELSELEQVKDKIIKAWERAKHTNDEFYLDSVAFNLHSFYTGLEKIFELIAVNVDGTKPEGQSWHRELLKQMSIEIN